MNIFFWFAIACWAGAAFCAFMAWRARMRQKRIEAEVESIIETIRRHSC